jgi:hypothetical protein
MGFALAVVLAIAFGVTFRRLRRAERDLAALRMTLASSLAHDINTPVQFASDNMHYVKEAFTSMADLVAVYRGATRSGMDADDREANAEIAREADELADTDYALENVPGALDDALEGLSRITRIVRSLRDVN